MLSAGVSCHETARREQPVALLSFDARLRRRALSGTRIRRKSVIRTVATSGALTWSASAIFAACEVWATQTMCTGGQQSSRSFAARSMPLKRKTKIKAALHFLFKAEPENDTKSIADINGIGANSMSTDIHDLAQRAHATEFRAPWLHG